MTRIILTVFLLCAAVGWGYAQNPRGRAAVADSSEQFADRIVKSDIPVLVDFWASWCLPCRYLDPVIHELEKEYAGRVLFMKVDIDVHRVMTSYFRVNAVPMVYIIEDKTVRSVINGVQPKGVYRNAIEDAIKLSAARKSKDGKCTVNC